MPRANRYFLPGRVWHITHRCHERQFLLKFAQDRRAWRYWVYQARKRYGLCLLNYVVTSNHVHLLVKDMGTGEIARSMQLISGRVAQQYNRRKARKGAFWEDRYHATAVGEDNHLARCMVYIDLNMVRAGVVVHPADWTFAGYNEIQSPPVRYHCIDISALLDILGFDDISRLRSVLRGRVDTALKMGQLERDDAWTKGIAVGERQYLEAIKNEIKIQHPSRTIEKSGGQLVLRERAASYGVK